MTKKKRPIKKDRENWVKKIREYIVESGGIPYDGSPRIFYIENKHKVRIIVRDQDRHLLIYSVYARFEEPYPEGTSNKYSGKHNYHASFSGDPGADIVAAQIFIDELKLMTQ